jgi:hypothetical protein
VDLIEGSRSVPRLTRKAEILMELDPHGQRRIHGPEGGPRTVATERRIRHQRRWAGPLDRQN